MSTPEYAKWDPDNLRRCEACGGRLIRVSEEAMRAHLGHRWHEVGRITVPEFLWIWLGWL